ncbi:MAG: bifunctional glutamate N-acetyltransferase/amino-acid acetyltransferase ArgJ [Bacillota bacterium]|jgi:glutamate N-acetyltransferase/amino-acid N-acetyltransferase
MKMTCVPGGVTAPLGFKAAGVNAEIKAGNKTKPDVAVIYSETIAAVGGVFTQNLVKAAPVLLSQQVVAGGKAQAVVVNSGNANACTGEEGSETARLMADWAAELLHINKDYVLVASTGVIGVQMPREKIHTGIKKAVISLSDQGGHDAARAIMTTDLESKEVAVRVCLGETQVTIGGMAKGSGMIHPNMATMLAFITTDTAIDQKVLQKAVKAAADKSFNMITVDGDTSTNDSMIVLANGAASNPMIEENSADFPLFQEALDYVCIELAKMMAKDGEGASKLIEVQVKNASTKEDAKKTAKAVVSSNLVKSAMFGEDANWGRIICAAGYSGAQFQPDLVDIWLKSAAGMEKMADKGRGLAFNEDKAKKILEEKEITVIIDFNDGNEEAVAWGCDLTYDYVKINADYRT